LLWLGIKTWRQAGIVKPIGVEAIGVCRAFREGIVVEALNLKTAAFFLAFVPQFVDPSAKNAVQFIVLGTISVGHIAGFASRGMELQTVTLRYKRGPRQECIRHDDVYAVSLSKTTR
jgi:threonine/homoserine/homoserine lactone efflux protein